MLSDNRYTINRFNWHVSLVIQSDFKNGVSNHQSSGLIKFTYFLV